MNTYTKEQKENFFKVTRFDNKVLQNVRILLEADELLLQKDLFEGLEQNHKFYMILQSEDKIELTDYAELMACIQLDIPFVIEKDKVEVTEEILDKMSKLFE